MVSDALNTEERVKVLKKFIERYYPEDATAMKRRIKDLTDSQVEEMTKKTGMIGQLTKDDGSPFSFSPPVLYIAEIKQSPPASDGLFIAITQLPGQLDPSKHIPTSPLPGNDHTGAPLQEVLLSSRFLIKGKRVDPFSKIEKTPGIDGTTTLKVHGTSRSAMEQAGYVIKNNIQRLLQPYQTEATVVFSGLGHSTRQVGKDMQAQITLRATAQGQPYLRIWPTGAILNHSGIQKVEGNE